MKKTVKNHVSEILTSYKVILRIHLINNWDFISKAVILEKKQR